MFWFRTGTISLTLNSKDVIAVGASFVGEVKPGEILMVDGVLVEIERVLNATTLRLVEVWPNANLSDVPYAIIRNIVGASNFDLMKSIENFLTDRQRSMDEFVDWMSGQYDAGPTENGIFPMTDRYGITVYAKSLPRLEYESNLLVTDLEIALLDANTQLNAIGNQTTWANQILGYKNEAAASALLASKWADNAENVTVTTGKYSAKHHAIKAAASQADVTTRQADVVTRQADVTAKQTDVIARQAVVVTLEASALASKTSATASASSASASATTATAKALESSTSATASAGSANLAAASKVTAEKWATEADDVAVTTGKYSAKHHANKAATSATNSEASKVASEAAKVAAEISKVGADTAKTAAQAAQTAAETAKVAAQASETSAATSATSATSSKNAALVSATNAADSATNAATSATNADASDTASAASSASASASESKAEKWAEELVDVIVEAGKYSALHHATKSAGSASTAATHETGAETARTGAEAANASAQVAKTDAETANTSAQAAKTVAETARDEAVSAAASLTGSLSEYGSIDLSGDVYPTAPSTAGFWKVTVGGTVDGVVYGIGDTLVYSESLTEFYKIDNTESVSSVNGDTGVVVLDAADVGALAVDATAVAASKLATARTISFTGDATGSGSFDGSANISVSMAVADNSHAHTVANVTDLQAALDAKQPLIGFSPVQQGTGTGQLSNNVKLGWSGAGGLLLQVDATDYANVWPISISKNAATATKLATARTINGVSFDGTANINVPAGPPGAVVEGGRYYDFHYDTDLSQDYDVRFEVGDAPAGVSGSGMLTIYSGGLAVTGGAITGNGSGLTTLNAANLASGIIPDARLSGTYTGVSITGNAATATTLTGLTATVAELNYTDGVTSNIQTQIDGKSATSHTHSYLPLTGGDVTGDINLKGTVSNFVGLGIDTAKVYSLRIHSPGMAYTYIGARNASYTHYESSVGNHYFYGALTCQGNITAYSDIRVKANIETIDNALEKVCQLNGSTFDRTDVDVPRQTGLIAQDVMKVLPEAIHTDPETGHMHVAYGNMVGLLVEAIKELRAEVVDLRRQVEGL